MAAAHVETISPYLVIETLRKNDTDTYANRFSPRYVEMFFLKTVIKKYSCSESSFNVTNEPGTVGICKSVVRIHPQLSPPPADTLYTE